MTRMTRIGTVWRNVLMALAAVLLAAGGARAQEHSDPPGEPIEPPQTPVGRQLAWVVRVINGEAIGALPARFTPRFLETFSEAEVTETLTKLRDRIFAGHRVGLVEIQEESENANALTGILNAAKTDRFIAAYLALDEKTGLIAGLEFNPAGYSCRAGDWETLQGDLGRMSGQVAFGAYELAPEPAGEGVPANALRLVGVYEFNERQPRAIAGAMQLWVLGALGEELAAKKAGGVKLEDEVALRPEWTCLPGGELSSRPEGSKVRVEELIRLMNEAGDTTATDHLVGLLTPATIESYVLARTRDARSSVPLLTLRQMFALKLAPDDAVSIDYARSNADGRAAMLAPDGDLATPEVKWDELETWNTPRLTGEVGYFCSARDLAGIFGDVRRLEQSAGLEQIAEGLRHDPGFEVDRGTWQSIAHKGGREPGVVSLAWLLKRDDGRWFTLAAIWNNQEQPVDGERLREVARAGAGILAKYGRDGAATGGSADGAGAPGAK